MVGSLFERETATNFLPSGACFLFPGGLNTHTASKVRRMCDSRYLPPDTKSALTQTPLDATSPLGRFMAETFLFSAPGVTSCRPHPSHFLSGFMWQQVAERRHVTPAALMRWPINLLLSISSTSGRATSRSAQLSARQDAASSLNLLPALTRPAALRLCFPLMTKLRRIAPSHCEAFSLHMVNSWNFSPSETVRTLPSFFAVDRLFRRFWTR